jgi:hypothetical protein
LGQPVQEEGTRIAMSDMIINITEKELDLPIPEIRQRIVCHCADGAIAKNLHIHKAHADKLLIPESYAKVIVEHDVGHRLELEAKNGKAKSLWLQDFDTKLECMLVHMRQDCNRNALIHMAAEMGVKYSELPLFCTTRFMEYSHRTYEKAKDMWAVINRVLEKLSSSDSSKAVDTQKGHKVFLQDPKCVLRLAFMEEVSNLLTILSK